MSRVRRLSCILSLAILVSLYAAFAKPAIAIVPIIQNVLVWESGGDVVVNVTVYHTPVDHALPHYVNRLEVNVSGTVHIFNIIQNSTIFTYPCNIGPVEGTPSAQVRARCIVDGYTAWTNFQIPEFETLVLLLVLFFGAAFAVFASRTARFKRF